MAIWEVSKKEVISFSAMATMEIVAVVATTTYKAAVVNGFSHLVHITYCNLIGAFIFLPLLFISPRSRATLHLVFSLPIFGRLVLLALIGYTSVVCVFKGIYYTSPTVAACISNIVPAFTFILAVAFKMESLDFGNTKTRAKSIGTVISISGALVTVLFKGPVIWSSESEPSSFLAEQTLQSSNANWVIGGVLLVGYSIIFSIVYIIQTQIVKLWPNELAVGVAASLLVSVIAAIFGVIVENDINAWTLRTDGALITVLFTGIFASSLITAVHTWCLNTKGPVYVAIFRPFSIIIAAVMGITFLGDALYIGSVIGANIIFVGFYAVLWGKTEEKEQSKRCADDRKTPLLAP